MNDPAINITGAIATIPFNEVLELLAQDRDIQNQLSQLTALLALRFHEDPDDLRQTLWAVLCDNISTLRDLKCLKAWARQTLGHYCINLYRHRKVEQKYREQSERQNVQFIRRSADGGEIIIFANMAMSPEEQLIEKERTEMVARLEAQLRVRVRLIFSSLTPGDALIARLWIEGMTLQQIAANTGRPVSTVQRRLVEHVQKTLIDDLELGRILDAKLLADGKLLAEGLRELLINTLRGEG